MTGFLLGAVECNDKSNDNGSATRTATATQTATATAAAQSTKHGILEDDDYTFQNR
jgi:hypothetical protein